MWAQGVSARLPIVRVALGYFSGRDSGCAREPFVIVRLSALGPRTLELIEPHATVFVRGPCKHWLNSLTSICPEGPDQSSSRVLELATATSTYIFECRLQDASSDFAGPNSFYRDRCKIVASQWRVGCAEYSGTLRLRKVSAGATHRCRMWSCAQVMLPYPTA